MKCNKNIGFFAAITKRDKKFGNARYVRNLFEKIVQKQANRLSRIQNPTKEQLKINFKTLLFMKKKNYTKPEIEVVAIAIEKGFASTNLEDPTFGSEF